MSAEDARWITSRLRPEPVAPSLQIVRLDSSTVGAVPVRYLFFSRTPDFMPCAVTRARLEAAGVPYDLIDAGHDGIITAASEVAAWLTRQGA